MDGAAAGGQHYSVAIVCQCSPRPPTEAAAAEAASLVAHITESVRLLQCNRLSSSGHSGGTHLCMNTKPLSLPFYLSLSLSGQQHVSLPIMTRFDYLCLCGQTKIGELKVKSQHL